MSYTRNTLTIACLFLFFFFSYHITLILRMQTEEWEKRKERAGRGNKKEWQVKAVLQKLTIVELFFIYRYPYQFIYISYWHFLTHAYRNFHEPTSYLAATSSNAYTHPYAHPSLSIHSKKKKVLGWVKDFRELP